MINKGFIAYGNPGSGKTESCLIGYLHYLHQCKPHWGWLLGDGKGNKDVYQKLVGAGIKPDYIVSTLLEHSDTLNLLGFNDPKETLEVASAILLNVDTSEGGAAFYAHAEENALRQIIPILFDVARSEGHFMTLRDVRAFLKSPECAETVINKASRINNNPIAIKELWEWNCSKHRMRNLEGLLQRIEILTEGKTADRWCDPEPTLNVERAVEQGEKIYLHLPESPLSRKIAIAITEVLRIIAQHRQREGGEHQMYPTLWEDWGGLIHNNWATIISRTRQVNIPASFSFQSVEQTETVRMTHDLDDSVLTTIVFNMKGVKSRRYCSQVFGEYETARVSVSDKTGLSFDGTNTQRVMVPRVTEGDLGNLAKGQCFIATSTSDTKGIVHRRFYKVRFSLIPMATEASFIEWPLIEKPLGRGLGLWDDLALKATELVNRHVDQQTKILKLKEQEQAQTTDERQSTQAPEVADKPSKRETILEGLKALKEGTAVVVDCTENKAPVPDDAKVSDVHEMISAEEEAQAANLLAECLPSEKLPVSRKNRPKKLSTKNQVDMPT